MFIIRQRGEPLCALYSVHLPVVIRARMLRLLERKYTIAGQVDRVIEVTDALLSDVGR